MRTITTLMLAGVAAVSGLAVAEPSLTIYNQDFAVVRETAKLDLQSGVNRVEFADVTASLEPDSVMLRDPSGKRALRILEQNYRNDPVSQDLLLSLFEGKTIGFLVQKGETREVVQGKVIRSGYTSPSMSAAPYGGPPRQPDQPIIEVDGKLRFGLPGQPFFPALTANPAKPDETILKPTLRWTLESDQAGPLDAELCYVTAGMSWEASYNLVAPEKGDTLDVVGWITMDNHTGRTFQNARIKLMAGDISRVRRQVREAALAARAEPESRLYFLGAPPVQEKTFDEYHLYTLELPTTLHDAETKQVEFVRASNVKFTRFYVYDGAKIDRNRSRSGMVFDQDANYGSECDRKVGAMCEFKNEKANGLGIPLPKGRTRFYRRDTDRQLEFTGENVIDHTPTDETVRVYLGSAFDLVGERKRTTFKVDHNARTADEAFEVTLRNHKKEAVEIRVIEHLYRGNNWQIPESSNTFKQLDSQTIEFRVQAEPDKEKVLTYAVHYTW